MKTPHLVLLLLLLVFGIGAGVVRPGAERVRERQAQIVTAIEAFPADKTNSRHTVTVS